MKIWQIVTVSAVAAIALPAFAQMATGPGRPDTRAEVEASVKDRLGKFDANKDGTVSPDEMKAYADARMKERNDAHFAEMDTDKNGSISRAEFDASHSKGALAMAGGPGERIVRIERHDRRGPGGHEGHMMTPPTPPVPGDESKPGERRTRIMMMGGRDDMMAMEGDGKGIVIADAVKKALERFDATDTNKDGTISPEERKAQRGVWRSMRSVG
jgi:hypothetical protein